MIYRLSLSLELLLCLCYKNTTIFKPTVFVLLIRITPNDNEQCAFIRYNHIMWDIFLYQCFNNFHRNFCNFLFLSYQRSLTSNLEIKSMVEFKVKDLNLVLFFYKTSIYIFNVETVLWKEGAWHYMKMEVVDRRRRALRIITESQ